MIMTDDEIREAIERCVRTLRKRFTPSRHLIDWSEVRSYAGECIALYLADVTPVKPVTCCAPDCDRPLVQPATGRVRAYCGNNCRARAGRRGVKANVGNQSAGLAHRAPEADRLRFVQQALNCDVDNWITRG